ncbi:MAG: low molecular weight protein-tyrosine-phosphatase [Planctomycetota bacterium]
MARGSTPLHIVFICTGNICRSPAAENIFRAVAAREGLLGELRIDSAGTGGWHEGEAPDPRSAAALRASGYPVDGRARALRAGDLDAFDLFICMDWTHVRDVVARGAPPERVVLIRTFDTGRAHDDVPDPYYGGDDGFAEMIAMLEASMDGLVARVREEIARKNGGA